MPNLLDILRLFRLTAFRPNGSGVAGATVRILNSAHNDVTAGFFTTISPITDQTGVVVRPFVVQTGLPAGTYTIQVIAQGFAPWVHITDADFIGAGEFTANLVAPTTLNAYLISEPTTKPASSMVPIVSTIETPNTFDWEYMRCKVEGSAGKSSVIEVPLDKATQMGTVDIRNRVALGTRPLLVSTAPLTARDDTDFSDVVEVSFRSLSPEGEVAVTYTRPELGSEDDWQSSFFLPVAATLPPDGESDLSSYVTPTAREWLVPFQPVMAFRGWYRDVSVWLPQPPATGYILFAEYFDGAGESVDNATASLNASDYVKRIRLDTDPPATAIRCVLIIRDGSTEITKPLTIMYRD